MISVHHIVTILLILAALPCQYTASATRDTQAVMQSRKFGFKADCLILLCPNPNATSFFNGMQANCSFLENCQCELLDGKLGKSGSYACNIQCPQLPLLRLVYYKKRSVLTATCIEKTESFNLIFSRFRNIIDVVNPVGLKLMNCHKGGVELGFYEGCKPENQHFVDPFNVPLIPASDKFLALILSDNCFTDFYGPFPVELELLDVLDMSSNLITKISDMAFHTLHFLGELHLAYNRITTITKDSFKGLQMLHTLNLESNKIASLSEDAFYYLGNLEMLSLRENQLTFLPAALIGHMSSMTTLDLAKNQLEDLPSHVFENLTYIWEIALEDNKLSDLPDDLFDGLMQLEVLDLSKNHLESLPNFHTNIRLRELDISSNYFQDLSALVTPFEFMGKLEELKIINNNITKLTLPLSTLKSFAVSVDMSQNCLQSYDAIVLAVPSDYDSGKFEFKCNDCCIKKVEKELVAGVTTAYFHNNGIETIDMEFLRLIAGMKEIDLSYNIIRDVDISWEYPLVKVYNQKPSNTTIRFHHNPVVCDCNVLPLLEVIGNITKPPYGQRRSNVTFDVHDMYCIEPPHLRGTPLDKLLTNADEIGKLVCNITGHCPKGCNCYDLLGDHVKLLNCTSRGSTTFPRLGNYGHPIYLHLENNTITKLPAIATWTWSQMKELYLDNNNLTSLENLIVFPGLRTLSLRNNSLDHLPQSMKSLFSAGHSNFSVNVLLSGNPWTCSCDLLEMRDLMKIKQNVLDFDYVTCVLPKSSGVVFLANATASKICPPAVQPIQAANLVKIILPTVASILVVLCVFAAFGYRYKEDIKLWLFRPSDTSCLVMNSRVKL